MITQNIVLVLGAGASMPFGFPSGAALKTEIITRLQPRDPWHVLLEEAGFPIDQIRDFRTALLKSGKRSVDAFLEHRTDFLEVGKAATACALLPRETEDSLFHPGKETWYEYFYTKLNAKFEGFSRNPVSVFTFNYDRSLEHYLFTALRSAYGKTSEECAEVLRSIPILHLYGQLGDLPPLSGDGVGIPYGAPVDVGTLRKAAAGIRIIHETLTNEQPFKQAHDLLKNASRVCFLGFGYDLTNMKRLLEYGPTGRPEVFGSAVGLTPRECDLIRSTFHTLGLYTITSLDWDVTDSLPFLRASCPFD
jgi:hypothetical protein